MPNKSAKLRKQQRAKLNKKLSIEGRTANQYKKWLQKNSDKPKACFLSSTVANEVRPFWGAYAVSKASLQHMVKIWSMENQNNSLSISIINPGKTNTKMRKQALPGENSDNLQNPKEVADKIKDIIFSNKIYKGEVIDLINFNLD